jgi:hypothetical protein
MKATKNNFKSFLLIQALSISNKTTSSKKNLVIFVILLIILCLPGFIFGVKASNFPCHSLSKIDLAKPWKSTGENVTSKTAPFNAARRARLSCCPSTFHPQASCKMGSTLF